jgi:hypothetical protein
MNAKSLLHLKLSVLLLRQLLLSSCLAEGKTGKIQLKKCHMRLKSEKKVIFVQLIYMLKFFSVANENSLKEIFLRKPQYWEKIFKSHLDQEMQPNFSIYRKPFEPE